MLNKTSDITNDLVTEYLNSFYKPLTPELGALRYDSEEKIVPVILRETETLLNFLLDIIKPEKVLEIGTAVGYSAMYFAEKMLRNGVEKPQVVSIEKNLKMSEEAIRNIDALGYSEYINVLIGDGAERIGSLELPDRAYFDMAFIDAGKSHYLEFMKSALTVLKPGSVIICDNTLFGARIASDIYDKDGKHRTNVRNMREFNEFVMNDPAFSSAVISSGDGLTLIKLK